VTAHRVPLEIVIVDRPGAGSGCACAGAANPELPRFAGDVEWLRWRVTDVRRMDPRETGTAFPDLPAARAALDERGTDALPLVLADGVVVHSGSYPSRETLQAIIACERVSSVANEPPR
jgi:Arsenical resistance operon protein ArsD